MLFSCFGGNVAAQEQPTITAISVNLNPNVSLYEGNTTTIYEYDPETNGYSQVDNGYNFMQLQVISYYCQSL